MEWFPVVQSHSFPSSCSSCRIRSAHTRRCRRCSLRRHVQASLCRGLRRRAAVWRTRRRQAERWYVKYQNIQTIKYTVVFNHCNKHNDVTTSVFESYDRRNESNEENASLMNDVTGWEERSPIRKTADATILFEVCVNQGIWIIDNVPSAHYLHTVFVQFFERLFPNNYGVHLFRESFCCTLKLWSLIQIKIKFM